MNIGLDLDNTIICYHHLFYRVASLLGLLNGSGLGENATKNEVKTWVQQTQGNDTWTELQGHVYGSHLCWADSFHGALQFLEFALKSGHTVCIISHKTQYPARGNNVDLRLAATEWLKAKGWIGDAGLSPAEVEFHETRESKLAAIERRNCDIFIDDLPEVFSEAAFPKRTTPILFDPENSWSQSTRLPRVSNWNEAQTSLEIANHGCSGKVGLAPGLLNRAGKPAARVILSLAGGRNNKVYRVCTAAGDLLFKSYFETPEDKRDRLRQEFDFLNHLHRVAPGISPKPILANHSERVSLMELVQGTRLTLDQVNERYVQQAIEFYLRANQQLDDPATRALLPASESCFSIDEHLMKTEIRVNRLREGIQIADDVDREAQELIMEKLLPIWYKTLQKIGGSLDKSETSEVLPLKERCLSPSDFGFHNALLQNDGTLRFLDFEFAGWDDPAKLIIDFANQPDMLLESRLSNLFREAVIHHHIAPKKLEKRVHLLEPIYQIKWACICMNCFLAFGRKRLQFTGGLEDELIMKRRQLAKARIMLARGSPI